MFVATRKNLDKDFPLPLLLLLLDLGSKNGDAGWIKISILETIPDPDKYQSRFLQKTIQKSIIMERIIPEPRLIGQNCGGSSI
jgi:hypothetical protein